VADQGVTLDQLADWLETVNREYGRHHAPLGSGGFLGVLAQYCRKTAGPSGTSQVAKQVVGNLREINPGRATSMVLMKLSRMRDTGNPANALAQLADALLRDQADPATHEAERKRRDAEERKQLIHQVKAKRRLSAGRPGVLYSLKAGVLWFQLQLPGNKFEWFAPVDETTLEAAAAERAERMAGVPA
jgi:hypothetical protein